MDFAYGTKYESHRDDNIVKIQIKNCLATIGRHFYIKAQIVQFINVTFYKHFTFCSLYKHLFLLYDINSYNDESVFFSLRNKGESIWIIN